MRISEAATLSSRKPATVISAFVDDWRATKSNPNRVPLALGSAYHAGEFNLVIWDSALLNEHHSRGRLDAHSLTLSPVGAERRRVQPKYYGCSQPLDECRRPRIKVAARYEPFVHTIHVPSAHGAPPLDILPEVMAAPDRRSGCASCSDHTDHAVSVRHQG
jgi:hypothetical protein